MTEEIKEWFEALAVQKAKQNGHSKWLAHRTEFIEYYVEAWRNGKVEWSQR